MAIARLSTSSQPVQPLDAVLEERLCGPLKMRDTGFKVPKDGVQGFGVQDFGVQGLGQV